MILGDSEGITSISLENIKELDNKRLVKILIKPEVPPASIFYFDDGTIYKATGFAIGYGGEGPHGLHKAIKYFYPNLLDDDFWATDIPRLDGNQSAEWSLEKGFIQ